MSAFQHEHLDLSSQQIRLILIEPAPDNSIHCTIQNYNFNNCPPYKALSYTWGEAHDLRTIFINHRPFEIRKNLFTFLEIHGKYHKDHTSEPLWIDQLCIDQSNTEERNHQVRFMRHIYSQAKEVIAWLGEGIDLELAIHEIRRSALPGLPFEIDNFEALSVFFYQAYWWRLWIVQEILLAVKVTIRAGRETLDWSELATFWESVYTQSADLVPPFSITAMALIEKKANGNTSFTLLDLLKSFHLQKCEDVRDRIYGLLGLVREGEMIDIDYSKSQDQIFYAVVEKMVEYEQDEATSRVWPYFVLQLRDRLGISGDWTDEQAHELVSDIRKKYGKACPPYRHKEYHRWVLGQEAIDIIEAHNYSYDLGW